MTTVTRRGWRASTRSHTPRALGRSLPPRAANPCMYRRRERTCRPTTARRHLGVVIERHRLHLRRRTVEIGTGSCLQPLDGGVGRQLAFDNACGPKRAECENQRSSHALHLTSAPVAVPANRTLFPLSCKLAKRHHRQSSGPVSRTTFERERTCGMVKCRSSPFVRDASLRPASRARSCPSSSEWFTSAAHTRHLDREFGLLGDSAGTRKDHRHLFAGQRP